MIVTNTNNGKTVTATVAGECVGCGDNADSLALSADAFEVIAELSEKKVPINYKF